MANKKADIIGIIDIEIIVDDFYSEVLKDKVLARNIDVYLNGRFKIAPEKAYAFWNMLLFAKGDFKGKPFQHKMPIELASRHFEKLLFLFQQSVDKYCEGYYAELAKNRAEAFADFFEHKTN